MFLILFAWRSFTFLFLKDALLGILDCPAVLSPSISLPRASIAAARTQPAVLFVSERLMFPAVVGYLSTLVTSVAFSPGFYLFRCCVYPFPVPSPLKTATKSTLAILTLSSVFLNSSFVFFGLFLQIYFSVNCTVISCIKCAVKLFN